MKHLDKFNEVYSKIIMEMNGETDPDIFSYENIENALTLIFPTESAIDAIEWGDLNTFAEIFLNDGGGYDWAIKTYGEDISLEKLPEILKEYVKMVIEDIDKYEKENIDFDDALYGDDCRWVKTYMDNGGKINLN